MFDSASVYEGSFDEWKPYGIPGAVQSDAGFDGFVKGPIEAHNREMQFAGDAIEKYMAVNNAHRNMETDKEISEMFKPKEQSSGGGGGMFGSIAKIAAPIAANAIVPGSGPIVSALGGLFG